MAEEPTSTEQETPEPGEPEKPKKTLEQQLEELRNNLESAQKQLKAAEVLIAQRASQINALSKLIGDLEQTATDYRPEYPGLEAAQKACSDYATNERNCLREILGDDTVNEVDRIAKEIREGVRSLKNEIASDERLIADREKVRETKLKTRDDLKAEFESLTKPAASIKDRLKELEAFKGEIRKAHDDGEYAIAYWLLTDSEKFEGRLTGELRVIDPDQLRGELKAAWKAYHDAADAFQNVDGEVQGLEKALETKKAELAEREKKLDATIRLKLTELVPSRSEAA